MMSDTRVIALDPPRADRGNHAAILRIAVLVAALAVLYLRVPDTFTKPQFWGEDGALFYLGVRLFGWHMLVDPVAGYYCTLQFLVSLAGNALPPAWAPPIFNYAAVFFTLLVSWMAMSPRFDMPFKPLLALAIVVSPRGYEVLGTITNIQWVLPVGAFILLFMRPATSIVVLGAEAVFLAVIGVTGPVSIFLAPLFVARIAAVRRDRPALTRMVLLTAMIVLGAIVQVGALYAYRDSAFSPGGLSSAPYPWTLWVDLAPAKILEVFGGWVLRLFTGYKGILAAVPLAALALFWSWRRPYRAQKLSMLFIALIIALSGMEKYRDLLGLLAYTDRYFYAGSVFALWFVCCGARTRRWQLAGAIVVGVLEVALLYKVADTQRIQLDLQWRVWAGYIDSGLPVFVPTLPPPWALDLPASPDGPLASFAAWRGKTLKEVGATEDPGACSGDFSTLQAGQPGAIGAVSGAPGQKAFATGWVRSASAERHIRVVGLVGPDDRILGFGFPGFDRRNPPTEALANSGWIATAIPLNPRDVVRAYGIVGDGRLCLLTRTHTAGDTPAE